MKTGWSESSKTTSPRGEGSQPWAGLFNGHEQHIDRVLGTETQFAIYTDTARGLATYVEIPPGGGSFQDNAPDNDYTYANASYPTEAEAKAAVKEIKKEFGTPDTERPRGDEGTVGAKSKAAQAGKGSVRE